MIKKKEVKPENRNKVLTAFILVFPLLILVIIGLVNEWVLRITLFVYEAIILKNFIDDYYKNIV